MCGTTYGIEHFLAEPFSLIFLNLSILSLMLFTRYKLPSIQVKCTNRCIQMIKIETIQKLVEDPRETPLEKHCVKESTYIQRMYEENSYFGLGFVTVIEY